MTNAPTDGELLMRFIRDQDEPAFEMLVRRHQASVFSVCYRVLGNTHDAEDAFQATFLVLARKARRFQAASSIGGWLFRVALRTAKNARSKKWRSKEEVLNVTPSSKNDPLAMIQEQELVTTLYEELGKLPEKYQTPIVLCMLEGKSRLEASTELECTVASLKARLARGRKQLRVNLTRRGVAFSVAVSAVCSNVGVADAAIVSLCSNTATNCSSYLFAAERRSISPDIVQLSEKGMSTMTLATSSKLAIASLMLLTFGIGSATLHLAGPAIAHGADAGDLEFSASPTDAVVQNPTTARIGKSIAVAQRSTSAQPVRRTITTAGPSGTVATISSGMNSINVYSNNSREQKVSKQANAEVIQALIEALEDGESQVAHNAAKTLISIGKGHEEVVEVFADLSAQSKDRKLRYYAVVGLGRIGGDDKLAARSLTSVLQKDSDPLFRKAAVEALGNLEMNDEVARTLASALKDSDANVRSAVARILGRLNPMHNSPLLPGLSVPKELSVAAEPGTASGFGTPSRLNAR